jgi:hypothetical protein
MSPHERQMDELRVIHTRWAESEWRLQFLRSFTGISRTAPTDDQLRRWDQTARQTCSLWQTAPAANWI